MLRSGNSYLRSSWVLFMAFGMAAFASEGRSDPSILSFQEAKTASEAGDARADAIVAMHYSLGWQVPKNPEAAIEYALRSAREDNPLGLYRIGTILRSGEGLPKNEAEGLRLQEEAFKLWNGEYLDSIREGDPYALLAAGILIFQGKVASGSQAERYQLAATLYQRAADRGFAPAQFNYSMCLIGGHGVREDREQAIVYLTESAKHQYPLAQKWLLDNGLPLPAAHSEPAGRNLISQGIPDSSRNISIAPPESTKPDVSFAFKKRFADKFAEVFGELSGVLATLITKSDVSKERFMEKLNASGQDFLANWIEQAFIAENLEAKLNESLNEAISQDRSYAYESATFVERILPLLADKRFTNAKELLLNFTASNPSPQMELAVLNASASLSDAIDSQILKSDALRRKASEAIEQARFQDAEQLLNQAFLIDGRTSDAEEISELRKTEKKHAFETDLGL